MINYLEETVLEKKDILLQDDALTCNYEQYLDSSIAHNQVLSGQAFRGKIKMDSIDNTKALLYSRHLNTDIQIIGLDNINWACHMDEVVV